MPWDYLNTTDLDARFLTAAGYLATGVRGKHLVELNCGTARLLHYLPATFARYTANDIHQQPDSRPPGLRFFRVPDDEMPAKLLQRPVDILMCFGLADGRKADPEWESSTLSQTFRELAKSHKPALLLLEASCAYNRITRVLDRLLPKLDGYQTLHDVEICSKLTDFKHASRRLVILTNVAGEKPSPQDRVSGSTV